MKDRIYICIDLKSFYASVECVERGLDPLTTNLVVADSSRTEKTICLAVSPALKTFGIPGRARLFEVVQKVKEINYERQKKAKGRKLISESYNLIELNKFPEYKVTYIVATPQMAHYIDISAKIYNIYLKYVAKEDIHVYSIDEVFIDVTKYLKSLKMTARELATNMIHDVLKTTGVTATAGIGTNMYLAKVAMDIVAKKIKEDKDGVRIAELDEMSYRRTLWNHRPLKDFWRVGYGYVRRLEKLGLYTMGDIAKCSIGGAHELYNEDLLYKEFGVNAELLIDHAWGYEPTTIQDIKAYKPKSNSLSCGQVLSEPYTYKKAKLVVKEMMDSLSLDLVEKNILTNQIGLYIGYDIENVNNEEIMLRYHGKFEYDYLGRKTPKANHGSVNLKKYSSSTVELVKIISKLFDQIVNPSLLIKRINVSANNLIKLEEYEYKKEQLQLNLFDDYSKIQVQEKEEKIQREKEEKLQKTLINIKNKFGKNSILKGMDLEEGATAKERNEQIGGHKS